MQTPQNSTYMLKEYEIKLFRFYASNTDNTKLGKYFGKDVTIS
jgi:hypothetical protein